MLNDKVRMLLPTDDVIVIQACLILHNIAMKHHDYVDPLPRQPTTIRSNVNVDETRPGKIARNHILKEFFGEREANLPRV